MLWHYAECCILFIIMLNVIMMSVVILSVMLSVAQKLVGDHLKVARAKFSILS